MKLPKPENWTLGTSERVIARLNRLFDLYEQHSCTDENGKETNQRANDFYLEGLSLQDKLPVEDAKLLKYVNLF